MGTPNIALYAGGPLGPADIAQNLAATQQAGWTTIILSLFHIGRPSISGQKYGDIIFNGSPMVVTGGQYVADSSWPNNVASLKQNGSFVTKIFASIGGGQPVVDFETIKTIYNKNGNSFAGTDLETNLKVFRQTFPSVDGIDLDCEDTYDQASFVAFCEMLIGMGFEITFCPYATWEMSFWVNSLAALSPQDQTAVKWWNLQNYGGAGDPQTWANAIIAAIPGFSTSGFMLAGNSAQWASPSDVTQMLQQYSGESCVGGGFIWNMDWILGASSKGTMADYVNAIKTGL